MATERYNAPARERHWQQVWEEADIFRASNEAAGPKCYVLEMFPYPSGRIHMGHVRNYTMGDVFARYKRAKGFNVLHPMGWDAFGMPAENAAIERKTHPAKWTYANIATMKAQLKSMGLSLDWSREIATCDPSYYAHQQRLFLDMLAAGLAYRKSSKVNWDPVDNTVLANEQVIDGRGWRSGALVETRELTQWFFKITHYSDELLEALSTLDKWPEKVRLMQANWIGRSEGMLVRWGLEKKSAPQGFTEIEVYTTRPDTLFGASFLAISPDHPLARKAAEKDPALAAFAEECRRMGTSVAELETAEKKGYDTGIRARHPLDKDWLLPVWVANFVLMDYGTGAIFGCPSGDQRDLDFARAYDLPVIPVILPPGADPATFEIGAEAYDGDGTMINSDFLDGLDTKAAFEAVAQRLENKTMADRPVGQRKVNYRLRDWGISRQRYWGCPIPIVHCQTCGVVPVPARDLPVRLPEDASFDKPGNPLDRHPTWKHVDCPSCGKPARRETDTMDTFVDSAWYYMRYCCPGSDDAMVDARNDYWMPMDQYIGGIEHAVLHLLYARFWTKAMRDLGLVKFDEPFTRLFTQGMLLNECFYREDDAGKKRWFYPSEVDIRYDERGAPVAATAKSDGLPVQLGGIEKMSKSKNNVVEPKDIIAKFGADTARVFTMFAGPPDQSAAWSDSGAEGCYRFLRRLWNAGVKLQPRIAGAGASFDGAGPAAAALRREIHLLLRQVTHDYERLQYNTVVSGAMKMLNAIDDASLHDTPGDAAVLRECFGILLRALYPAAPHIAHVLWKQLGYAAALGDLIDAPWPQVDETALALDEIELVLQVNGKHRGSVRVSAQADRAAIEAAALASPECARFAEGRAPKKIVIVPGRLVNVVA